MTKVFNKKRGRVQILFPKDGLTKQSFRDECNINTIMQKYQRTGLLEHVSVHGGHYGDYTDVQDYQTSLNQVMAAQTMFMSLPSTVRARFSNDPSNFLDFVADPSNVDEMRSMGLLQPEISAPNVVPLDSIQTSSSPE